MSKKDRPFMVYRRGPTEFIIVPRGIKGWLQFGAWLALLVPLIIWFESHVSDFSTGPDFVTGLVLFVVGVIAWLICAMWWMFARAEVVEVSVWKRERQREKRERERRERTRER